MQFTPIARALGRDRWLFMLALAAITLLALGYTYWLATGFDMSDMMSPHFVPWSAVHLGFMLAMWVVMMVGMMTPSVAPTILLYAAIALQNGAAGDARRKFAPPVWFLSGYLLAWTAFAIVATLLQWLLEWRALVTPMMAVTPRVVGGVMLIAAGIYQWLPLKQTCLTACHSPISFVQRHGGFQPGAFGSLRLGFLHGLYCIGCCWTLMLLLFAFGVMNLMWIAGLMVFVLLEKILPWPRAISLTAGVVAVLAGVSLLI